MSETIALVENVSFKYEGSDTYALNNVSFKVHRGELLAIMGPNGAGKTTLCYLLSGIIPNIYGGTRKGKVRVLELDPWDYPIYETAKTVGILLQDPEAQLIMPSVFAELAFGPANLGVPKDEILRRIRETLKIIGLEGFEDRHPRELSGGQKQRVALGAILTMMQELIVLDEPTSQLDPIGTTEVFSAIKKLKEMGKTIILTSHKTEEVAKLADNVIILNDGKVVAQGPPEKVLSDIELLEEVGVKSIDYSRYFHEISKRGVKVSKIPIFLKDAVSIAEKLIRKKVLDIKSLEYGIAERGGEKEPIIEVKNLTYVYPGEPPVTALKDINLTIYKGDFIGIIGQNGSGKTTLVKNIVGLLRPTKGKIYFHGEDLSKYTVGELARRIGLILQNPDYQLFSLSCEEEIAFGLKNIGLNEEEIEKRVEESLKFVGLYEKRDKYPFALSFGDRRKLAVAVVVAMRPEVIIMDEPTTAQDYRGRYMLAELAKKVHEEYGSTIIMISHDMDLIAKYAKRAIVMANGKIIADAPTRKVFQMHDVLREAFLKPPQITRFAQSLSKYNVSPEVMTVEEMLEVLTPSTRGGLNESC